MATPTFTLLNHQPLSSADTNTGWNDLTTADADIKVEGTASMSGVFRANGEQGYYDAGSAPVTAAGKTLRGWVFTNNIAYMGVDGSGDEYKLLAFDGSTTEVKPLFASDTYPGGWFNYIWDMDEFTTLTLANVQRWGVESGHASNAKNVVNTWMDVIRYLDGYSMVGGTTGDRVRLSDIASLDSISAYGVCSNVNNVYFATGTLQFGTGATAHWFEASRDVLVLTDQNVAAGLYSISAVGAGTTVVIENSVLKSVGTADNTRFAIDLSDTNLASATFTGNLCTRASTIDFKSGQTMTNNTYDDCGQIIPAGADVSGSIVRNYGETADTAPTNMSALVYDETSDPDGKLDNMSFTKGTEATHAIEFGVNSPLSMTLRGITFDGYNASNNQNDSAIHVKRTSGTVTISIAENGTSPSYRTDGATVNIVVPSQVLTITGVPTGAEYRLYEDDPTSGVIGTTELQGAESWTGGNITYNYTWASDVDVALQVIEPGYVEYVTYFTLTSTSQTVNVVLQQETNT
jgi:hypothetical protein